MGGLVLHASCHLTHQVPTLPYPLPNFHVHVPQFAPGLARLPSYSAYFPFLPSFSSVTRLHYLIPDLNQPLLSTLALPSFGFWARDMDDLHVCGAFGRRLSDGLDRRAADSGQIRLE